MLPEPVVKQPHRQRIDSMVLAFSGPRVTEIWRSTFTRTDYD